MTPLAHALGFVFAAAVWILPGIALAPFFDIISPRDWAGRAAVAAALGITVSVGLALVGWVVGLPADRLYLVLAGAAGVSLVWILIPVVPLGPRSRAAAAPAEPRTSLLIANLVMVASVVLLAAAGIHAGSPFRFTSDVPDHVGTLREILASGSYFPTEAFHAGAGLLGADPRKGLLHPVYAALSQTAGLDPVDFWLLLPAVTAPLLLLAGYLFARGFGFGPGWSAVGSWLLLLTWNGGIGAGILGISPYPNQLGETLFWSAAAAILIALRQGGKRKAVAAGLLMFGAVAVHAMYLVFLAAFGGLALAAVLIVRGDRRRGLGTLLLAAGSAAVLLLPYLLLRYRLYAPANPIHTELQGMLLLGRGRYLADPLRLWRDVGTAGLVAYPAFLALFIRAWLRNRARFVLWWGALLVLFLTLNPFLVPVERARLSYLVFRLFWLVPPGILAAAVLAEAVDRTVARRRPAGAIVAGALVLVGLVPPALKAAPLTWLTVPARRADGSADALRWRPALERLAAQIPPRSVILSDPVTAYLIPAFTPLKVTATLDQHSSPNDSLAVARIVTARDVLSPATLPAVAASLAREAGADFVLVNAGFDRPVDTIYARVDPSLLRERARAFAASPAFTLAARDSGMWLFRPESTGVPATGVPFDAGPAAAPGDTLFQRDGLAVLDASVLPAQVAAGDSLEVRVDWSLAAGPVRPSGWTASVRFDALSPPGAGFPAPKPARKLFEFLEHRRYRFRYDWVPGRGRIAPDRWLPGHLVTDAVHLRVPETLAPGRYAVSVSVNVFPNMPNTVPADYLSDRDVYAGAPVDTVEVLER